MGLFDDLEEAIDAGGGERGVQADPDAVASAWDTLSEEVSAVAETVNEYASAGGGERGVQADPDAVSSAWEALGEEAGTMAQQVAADPGGAAIAAAEAANMGMNPTIPVVEVKSDGESVTGVTVSNVFGKGNVKSHDDGHVTGDMDFSAGPAGGLKGQVATDASGNVTKLSGEGKLSIDDVGAEAKGGYEETADGWKGTGSLGVSAPVEGVPMKGEVRGGYEDMGDRGFKTTGGASVGVSADGGEGMVEGSVMKGTDLDYSDVDGQQTVGVRQSTTVSGEFAGQEVAQVKLESGVAYTTGPDGERVIVHQEASGQVGTESLGSASGGVRSQREWGTDAQGNEVDRTTTTVRGEAKSEGLGIDEKVEFTTREERVDAIGTRPGDVPFDAINPDFRREVPLDAINPDLRRDVPLDAINPDLRRYQPAPRPSSGDVPLDAINPDLRRYPPPPTPSRPHVPPQPGHDPYDRVPLEEPLLGGEIPASRTDEAAPVAWEETPGVSETVVEGDIDVAGPTTWEETPGVSETVVEGDIDVAGPTTWEETPGVSETVVEGDVDEAGPTTWEETPDVSETVVERVETYQTSYEEPADSGSSDYSTEYPLE